jgi:hypothetical protein
MDCAAGELRPVLPSHALGSPLGGAVRGDSIMCSSEENLRSMEFYAQHYEVVVDLPLVSARRTRIRDHNTESERRCRFCGKSKPAVSFRHEAHAIPEFLGNKSIILLNECDGCNTLFASEYEDHLAKWFGPMRTLCQIRGREGIPEYKYKRFRAKKGNGGMELCVHADSSSVNIADGGSFTIPVEMRADRYIPLRAAQALVKSAVSILPKERLPECQGTIQWLLRKATAHISDFPVVCGFTPGVNPYRNGRGVFYRRKDPCVQMPSMWFAVATANFLFQVMIPFCSGDAWIQQDKPPAFAIVPIPTPFPKEYEEKFGGTEWTYEDWAQDEEIVQNRRASLHVDLVDGDKIDAHNTGGTATNYRLLLSHVSPAPQASADVPSISTSSDPSSVPEPPTSSP